MQIGNARQRIMYLVQNHISTRTDRLAGLARQLHTVSPLETLGRGYSITSDSATGEILRNSEQARIGQTIESRLASGRLLSVVKQIAD